MYDVHIVYYDKILYNQISTNLLWGCKTTYHAISKVIHIQHRIPKNKILQIVRPKQLPQNNTIGLIHIHRISKSLRASQIVMSFYEVLCSPTMQELHKLMPNK